MILLKAIALSKMNKVSRPKSFLEDLPGLHLSENTLSAEILPGSAF
ncbi:hypothetical protein NIES4075_54280 [Tolypothrix sp. NIES-4075]|nr:hypothetical protein NIES4075_54280 [Tolypothrix sp. NIES-4075]